MTYDSATLRGSRHLILVVALGLGGLLIASPVALAQLRQRRTVSAVHRLQLAAERYAKKHQRAKAAGSHPCPYRSIGVQGTAVAATLTTLTLKQEVAGLPSVGTYNIKNAPVYVFALVSPFKARVPALTILPGNNVFVRFPKSIQFQVCHARAGAILPAQQVWDYSIALPVIPPFPPIPLPLPLP
jgi:hypothetical protein